MNETPGEIRARLDAEQHARYWKRVDDERYLRSFAHGRPDYPITSANPSVWGFMRWLFGYSR